MLFLVPDLSKTEKDVLGRSVKRDVIDLLVTHNNVITVAKHSSDVEL